MAKYGNIWQCDVARQGEAMTGPGAGGSGRTVTLQDVAREADVAVSTVSRALSNPDRVSRPMRERVQEVARRLGYTSGRMPVRDSAGWNPRLARQARRWSSATSSMDRRWS